jgi:hypothetical protein
VDGRTCFRLSTGRFSTVVPKGIVDNQVSLEIRVWDKPYQVKIRSTLPRTEDTPPRRGSHISYRLDVDALSHPRLVAALVLPPVSTIAEVRVLAACSDRARGSTDPRHHPVTSGCSGIESDSGGDVADPYGSTMQGDSDEDAEWELDKWRIPPAWRTEYASLIEGGMSSEDAVALLRARVDAVNAHLRQIADFTAEQRKRYSEMVAQGMDRDEAIAEVNRGS